MTIRLAGLAFIVFILTTSQLLANELPVKVVVNGSVETTQLTSAQLRKIFSMRQTFWPDGKPITVFVLPSQDPAHQALCKDILKMFPYQVERQWNKLAYSGLGDKPTEVSNQQQMLEKVEATPGAIGYLFTFPSSQQLKEITVKGD